jgi:hypothetical protein
VADVHEVSDYAWLDFISPLGYAFHPVSDQPGVSW